MYYVYMIKNDFNDLYVGVTKNLKSRLYCHNTKQGSKFTKHKTKFILIFSESYNSLTEARGREIQIKKWRRDKKEMLVEKFNRELPTKQR